VRVGELFRNLITNATKYNDKDNKWIEIGHSDGVFHVRDNGIGIAPEHHEKVFTIFKRLHKRDDFGGGTGAGLTIVQRIVERHNGKVWLESEPGVGTTFFFTLQEHGPQNTLQNTAIVSKTS
jgi:light-regulated signal transduction histidine kinase (bacteriophytochrome)